MPPSAFNQRVSVAMLTVHGSTASMLTVCACLREDAQRIGHWARAMYARTVEPGVEPLPLNSLFDSILDCLHAEKAGRERAERKKEPGQTTYLAVKVSSQARHPCPTDIKSTASELSSYHLALPWRRASGGGHCMEPVSLVLHILIAVHSILIPPTKLSQ